MLERIDFAAGKLANSFTLAKTSLNRQLESVTEVLADTLNCTRCSLWRTNRNSTKFTCLDYFDAVGLAHSADLILPAADHPILFGSLEAHSVEIHRGKTQGPLAREFEAYMDLQGTNALLLIPLRAPDLETGLIIFEHTNQGHRWSKGEHHAAAILGRMCTQLIADKNNGSARTRESEALDQFHQVLDFLPDPTFIIDKAGVVQAWNEAMEQMTGIPKTLIIGHGGQIHSIGFYGVQRAMLIDLVLSPNPEVEKNYTSISRRGDTLSGEASVSGLNGGKGAILLGSARPLYDALGDIRGAIEIIHDVTVLKKAERTAQDWQRRYEMVSAASGQVTYEITLKSGLIQWSNTSNFVLGVELKNKAFTFSSWLEMISPEDRLQVQRNHEESCSTGYPFATEYRVSTDSGIHWLRDHAYMTLNSEGEACRLGMIVDITAAHRAEEQIKQANDDLERRVTERTSELAIANQRLLDEIVQRSHTQKALSSSEEKYRSMVDALPQIVFELDLSGRILLLNKQGYEMSGLSQDDLQNNVSIMEFIHPEDLGRLRNNWSLIISGEAPIGSEYRFVGRNGRSFPATTYSQMVSREGAPSFVTGFLIDETERIKAREALEQAHAQLERRVEQRTAELAASNTSMKELLTRQEINIGLASRVLQLVNSVPPRNIALPGGQQLFIAAHMVPRNKEGGDHFFSRSIGAPGKRRTLVSLKDESGHEVGCILRSIITDLFHNALLMHKGDESTLPALTNRLNQELCNCHLFEDGEYLTAATLEIHHETLQLHYLLAGHPPFLLIRDARVTTLPGSDRVGANLPLGMIEQANFRHGELQLLEGDKILLYTDGLLELPTASGKPALSASQLASVVETLLNKNPKIAVSQLAQMVLLLLSGMNTGAHRSPEGLPDDVSLVALELEPSRVTMEHCLRPSDISDLSRQRTEIIHHINSALKRQGLPPFSARLGMVLEEAIYNAWKHGNRESPEACITVRHSVGNDLSVEIIDEGPGFDANQIPDPTAPENRTKPSGRGLFIIRRFADEAEWIEGGRHLRLHFAPGPCFIPTRSSNSFTPFRLWN